MANDRLRRAVFKIATLERAVLRDADLSDANLVGVIGLKN